MIASSSVMYEILNISVLGLVVPLMVSIISISWLIGVAIKAMRSNDLVNK